MSFFFEIFVRVLRVVQDDRLYVVRSTIPYLLGFASLLQLYVPVDRVGIDKYIARWIDIIKIYKFIWSHYGIDLERVNSLNQGLGLINFGPDNVRSSISFFWFQFFYRNGHWDHFNFGPFQWLYIWNSHCRRKDWNRHWNQKLSNLEP